MAGDNIFHIAARARNGRVIPYLLYVVYENGKENLLEQTSETSGLTPLQLAQSMGENKRIKDLLEKPSEMYHKYKFQIDREKAINKNNEVPWYHTRLMVVGEGGVVGSGEVGTGIGKGVGTPSCMWRSCITSRLQSNQSPSESW